MPTVIDSLVTVLSIDASGMTKGADEAETAQEKIRKTSEATAAQLEADSRAAVAEVIANSNLATEAQRQNAVKLRADADALRAANKTAADADRAIQTEHAKAGKVAGDTGRKAAKEKTDAELKAQEAERKRSKEIEENGKHAAEAIARVRNQVLGLFAAFEAGKGMSSFISDTTKAEVATGRLAARIGLTARELSLQEQAAERLGGTSSGVDESFQAIAQKKADWLVRGNLVNAETNQIAAGVTGTVAVDYAGDAAKVKEALQHNARLIAQQRGGQFAEDYGKKAGLSQSDIDLAIKYTDAQREQARVAAVATAITQADVEAGDARTASWSRLNQILSRSAETLLTNATPALDHFMDSLGTLIQSFETWAETDDNLQSMIKALDEWVQGIDWNAVEADIKDAGAAVGQFFDVIVAAARKLGLIDAKSAAEAKADADKIAADPNATQAQKDAAAKEATIARHAEAIKNSTFGEQLLGSIGLGPLGSEEGYDVARRNDALAEAGMRNRQLDDNADRVTEITTAGPGATSPAPARSVVRPSADRVATAPHFAHPSSPVASHESPAKQADAVAATIPAAGQPGMSLLDRIARGVERAADILLHMVGLGAGASAGDAQTPTAVAPSISGPAIAAARQRLVGAAQPRHAEAAPTVPATQAGVSSKQQLMSYFQSQGWSKEQSAGLVANLVTESNLRPDAVGDSGHAYGIGQWHKDRQDKFKALFGKDIKGSSLLEQAAFVQSELAGDESHAAQALKRSKTAAEAGAAVSKYYERPRDVESNQALRGRLAERIAAEADIAPKQADLHDRVAHAIVGAEVIALDKFRHAVHAGLNSRLGGSAAPFAGAHAAARVDPALVAATQPGAVSNITNAPASSSTDNSRSVQSETHIGEVHLHTATADPAGHAAAFTKEVRRYDYAQDLNTSVA